MPDRDVLSFPLADDCGSLALSDPPGPPIRWPRMIAAPDDNVASVPIKIMVQPGADGEPGAEGQEKTGPQGALHINHVGLIDGHINYLRVGGKDFDGAILGNDGLLRCGLQVAECLSLG